MSKISKIALKDATLGPSGQHLLAKGDDLQVRVWKKSPDLSKDSHSNPYEVAGFVLEGRARLHTGDDSEMLTAGDSWVIPADTDHRYEILEPFASVEVVG